jgi:hypothetical protein
MYFTPTVLWTSAATMPVSSTTGPATLLDTGVGTKTILANYLSVGSQFKARLRGEATTKSSSPGTFRIRFYFDATNFVETDALTPSAGLTDEPFDVDVFFSMDSLGVSARANIGVRFMIIDTSTPALDLFTGAQPVFSTIDTTADLDLDIKVAFATADSINKLVMNTCSFELLNFRSNI